MTACFVEYFLNIGASYVFKYIQMDAKNFIGLTLKGLKEKRQTEI